MSAHAAASGRTTGLAFVCVVVWLAAAASTGPLGIWISLGGAAVALGFAVLLVDLPLVRGLLRPSPRLVLLGVVAGGVMAAATYLLYPVLAATAPSIAADTALLYSALRVLSPVIASVALIPIVIGEELVWRGVVQAALLRWSGPWGGLGLAAVAYAIVHAPLGSPVLVAVALVCGFAWGALRTATASLVPTLVAHLVWDALVLLWLPMDAV